ncbi:hypothetical protein ACQPYK_03630 [Streptosporangium sp. CA-135522]|uniref:hypothetical protein n=1 Tax=Streptosporangium sp. CA-135522 TaxID=3240072 RepID=UPI003D937B9D
MLYFGSSGFAGRHIAQAQEAARSRYFLALISEQSICNLMSRWVEPEVLLPPPAPNGANPAPGAYAW